MPQWTPTDRRIGLWAAVSLLAIVLVYLIVGGLGLVTRPAGSDVLRQRDPFLAVMEFLMILSALTFVVLMAAVVAYAPPDRKTAARVALAFMTAFAVITCSVHFVSLTFGRQTQVAAEPPLSRLVDIMDINGHWPSMPLALDLLAWDFLFGWSLLFGAPAFRGNRLNDYVRACMMLAGVLCLAGTFGPLLGKMQLQYFGIIGYAFLSPIVCALVALAFARADRVDAMGHQIAI